MIDEAGVSTNLSTPPVEHSDDGWTGSMAQAFTLGHDAILQRLSQAFNHSPFMAHSGMQMRVVNGQIEGHMDMAAHLVGNVAFRILHGGGRNLARQHWRCCGDGRNLPAQRRRA